MTIDLARLRIRIGLAADDESQDPAISAAIADVIGIAELYLDRALTLGDYTEIFEAGDSVLILRGWPVTAIASVTADDLPIDVGTYRVNLPWGRISSRGGEAWPQGPVTVTYTGGFDDFPAPLEWALLQIFDIVWRNDPAYGGVAGASSTGPDIQKVSVVGVGSIDYGSTSASGSASGGQADPWGMIPADVADVLLRYANNSVIGVG